MSYNIFIVWRICIGKKSTTLNFAEESALLFESRSSLDRVISIKQTVGYSPQFIQTYCLRD